MSEERIARWTCDRCGNVTEVSADIAVSINSTSNTNVRPGVPDGWGGIIVLPNPRQSLDASGVQRFSLCGECTKSFRIWRKYGVDAPQVETPCCTDETCKCNR